MRLSKTFIEEKKKERCRERGEEVGSPVIITVLA
jgi:hypothetical protein